MICGHIDVNHGSIFHSKPLFTHDLKTMSKRFHWVVPGICFICWACCIHPWHFQFSLQASFMEEKQEEKGMKISTSKTNVLILGWNVYLITGSCNYPCHIYRKEVGANPIESNECSLWVYKNYSKICESICPDPPVHQFLIKDWKFNQLISLEVICNLKFWNNCYIMY